VCGVVILRRPPHICTVTVRAPYTSPETVRAPCIQCPCTVRKASERHCAGPEYQNRLLAQMDMPKPSTQLRLDFSSFLGPLFFTWMIQFLLPWSLVQLVYEKQHNLRMMMRMHGLANSTPSANFHVPAVASMFSASVDIAVFQLKSGCSLISGGTLHRLRSSRRESTRS
jgi:hypothetical protein